MNNLVIVGKVKEIKKQNNDNGGEEIVVTVAVTRNFQNVNGEYDKDIIDVTMWNAIANTALDYLKENDTIGIKGRIQRLDTEKEMKIIAEKVTFLSSEKKEEK